jgi:hypothetical protein
MALHGTIQITIPRVVMGKLHVIITGIRTRGGGMPRIMVLLAVERMVIVSLSLTTIIRLSAPSLDLKAILPLANNLLILEVITLRSVSSTIDKMVSPTVTTVVEDKTTKGHHRGTTLTHGQRSTAEGTPMITATIADTRIGNMIMIMVIIVHGAILSVVRAENIRASMKGQLTTIKA